MGPVRALPMRRELPRKLISGNALRRFETCAGWEHLLRGPGASFPHRRRPLVSRLLMPHPRSERLSYFLVAPPGSNDYTLSFWEDRVVVNPSGRSGTVLVSNPFTVAASQCVDFFKGGDMTDGLWVRQAVTPAGVRIDSITVATHNVGAELDCAINVNACPKRVVDATDQVYVEMHRGRGADVTFYNSRPAPEPGPVDTDKDGVLDVNDNCPAVKNPLQLDLDNDKLGTACDPAFNLWFAPLVVENVCANVFRVLNNPALDVADVDYAVSGRTGYTALAIKASAPDAWFSEKYIDAGRKGTVTLRERRRVVGYAYNKGIESCPASVLAKVGN